MNNFQSDPKLKRLKILVAEDSGLSFALTEALIERLTGNRPDRAVNGLQAVEKVQSEEYDLVLMDHLMPEMNGTDATRMIRDLLPEWKQPFIAGLSGACTSADIGLYEACGMNRFLAKPMRLVQLNDLLHVVANWDRRSTAFRHQDSMSLVVAG